MKAIQPTEKKLESLKGSILQQVEKKNSKGAPSNLHLTRKMAVNSEEQKQV